ncbi:glycosyltransferase [Chloroflexi bacterium TSY]|nr:glycosyltransferase [Chloroflexi bacterium TSY]
MWGVVDVDPAYVDLIRRQIRDGNFDASIELVGSVNDDLLRNYFMQSHLLVLPSYEGFGIVYLEAMSFGLPVIASTTGAAHEIVSHGTNGFLVDPANLDALSQSIHLLHEKRNDLVKMSLAARETYDRHPRWEQSMSRIRHFLDDFGSRSKSQTQNSDICHPN